MQFVAVFTHLLYFIKNKQLQEYGRAYHECRVVFFTAGQYKIDIQCSSKESAPNSPILYSELVNAGHTWRYIPPIEITVDDY